MNPAVFNSIRRQLYSSGEALQPLVVDGSTITLANTEANLAVPFRNFWTPQLLYNNGKTYFAGTRDFTGKLTIKMYDDRYGFAPLFAVQNIMSGGTNDGSHHLPAIGIENNKLYALREKEHNIDPIGIHRTINTDDIILWENSANVIANGIVSGEPTYPNIYKKNDRYILPVQVANNRVGIQYNLNGVLDDSGWSGNFYLTDAPPTGEYYVCGVVNSHVITDSAVVLVSRRLTGTPPAYSKRFPVKISVAADGTKTYANWDGTFTKASTLTTTELETYFEYFDTGSTSINGEEPTTAALDNQGNFYDIGRDGSGNNQFYYLAVGQSSTAPTTKPFPSTGVVKAIIPVSASLVYAFVIETGDLIQYSTTDLGDNWTNDGDVFPDVTDALAYFQFPYNYGEIGNNRNFIIAAYGTDKTFVKKAAFGAIQSEAPNDFYINSAVYSEAEYNALMDFSYFIESGKITNTGTACNSIIDQSPNARNVNSSGSPVLDSGTTPTFLTMDGVNDFFSIPTTGLTAKTKGIVIGVTKSPFYFLTAANTAGTDRYMRWGQQGGFPEYYWKFGVPDVQLRGQTTVDPATWNIYMFQHTGEGDVLIFYNGKLQRRNCLVENANEGKFFNSITGGLSNINIGRLERSTISYTSCPWKHIALCAEPQTLSSLAKMHKFLSGEFGISLTSPFF